MFTKENQKDYRALPAKVSNNILILIDKNFKSFFSLLKKKKEGKYDAKIKIPNYLDKSKGKQVVLYGKQSLSFKKKDISIYQKQIYLLKVILKKKK